MLPKICTKKEISLLKINNKNKKIKKFSSYAKIKILPQFDSCMHL